MDKNNTGVFNKFDAAKHGKLILLISLVIVLIGVLVVGIFGFNLAYEYGGGYRVTVEFDSNIMTEAYKDYEKQISKTIESLKNADGEDYGLNVKSVKTYKALSGGIEVTNMEFTAGLTDSDSRIEDIFKTDLSKELDKLGSKSEKGSPHSIKVTNFDYNAKVSFGDAFFVPFAAVILTTGVICIYFAFRYNVKEAIAAAYALISGAILLTALLGILRIPFNSNIIVLIAAALIESVFMLSFLFDGIKAERAKPGNEDAFEGKLISLVAAGNLKKNLIVLGVSAVAAAALFIGAYGSVILAAGGLIAVIVGALNGALAAPAVMALLAGKQKVAPVRVKKEKPAPAPIKAKPAKVKPEEVKQEEQSVADNAEVAPVEDIADEEVVTDNETANEETEGEVEDDFNDLDKLNQLEELDEFEDEDSETADNAEDSDGGTEE